MRKLLLTLILILGLVSLADAQVGRGLFRHMTGVGTGMSGIRGGGVRVELPICLHKVVI